MKLDELIKLLTEHCKEYKLRHYPIEYLRKLKSEYYYGKLASEEQITGVNRIIERSIQNGL